MNPESIKQIVETIKTLNFNINDATTQKLAEAVMPIVKYYLILDLVKSILSAVVIVLCIYFLSKYIYKTFKEKDTSNL